MPTSINIQNRKTKTAVLLVGEGHRDKAFLRHLQDIYISREGDVAVKVECGVGGSPRSVIERTIRLRANKAYNKCMVVIDGDRPLETDRELRREMRAHPPIVVIDIKPCMEGLLLDILEHPNFSRRTSSADMCKHEFSKCIPHDKQTEKSSYARVFTRSKLDSVRKRIRDLDTILKIMSV